MKVTKFTEFDVGTLSFGPMQVNSYGGQFIPISDSRGGSVYVTTPPMQAPFGLAAWTKDKPPKRVSGPTTEDTGPLDYSISLALDPNNPAHELFRSKLEGVCQSVIAHLHQKSEAIFEGKKKSMETLEDQMYPIIKKDKQGKYDDKIKLKVSQKDGMPQVPTFRPPTDQHGAAEKLTPFDVSPRCTVKAIVQLDRIAFVGQASFSVPLRAAQIVVVSTPSDMTEYAMPEEDEAMMGMLDDGMVAELQ